MDVSKIGGSPDLVQKWSKALDGIRSDYTARVTAQLLENQAKAVLAETQWVRLSQPSNLESDSMVTSPRLIALSLATGMRLAN